jgi:hypothetical protein
MLISPLAVLGVDLIVLFAFAAVVCARTRWVQRRPGVFSRRHGADPMRPSRTHRALIEVRWTDRHNHT